MKICPHLLNYCKNKSSLHILSHGVKVHVARDTRQHMYTVNMI